MGWFGKFMFGSLGMLVGGPLGAIAGAALGHHLVDKAEEYADGPRRVIHAERSQAAYFVTMFAVLGKLAKADGIVTKDEIAAVEHFINSLHMDDSERQFARQVFHESKDSPYSMDDFAAQFYQIAGGQPSVLSSFLDVLFRIAAADGAFHLAEEAALKKIQNIFHISDEHFNNLKANYFKGVDRYYKALNCTPQCSNDEIKSNYKKMVKDFHPDRIVSKGLPEEFMDFATKRFMEIQEAYEKIREERKF